MPAIRKAGGLSKVVGGAYSLLYRPNTESVVLDTGLALITWIPLYYAGVLTLQGIAEHRRFRTLAVELGA